MFIERSTARIRGVRTLFVLVGAMPCAVLVAWAVIRHAPAHRDALCRQVEHVLGMPLAIGSVEHIRPNALRLRDCVVSRPGGAPLFQLAEVEVETSADEVRLRLPAVSCGPDAVAALAGVARAWLEEPVRFSKAWVVEIGALAWDVTGHGPAARADETPATVDGFPLRIECVAAGDSRAVRLHRVDLGGQGDEVRLVATADNPRRHEFRGSVGTPIPWTIVQAMAPLTLGGLSLGPTAVVSGDIEASATGGVWSGAASGFVDGIRLEDLAAGARHRLEGSLAVEVERLEWHDGRLVMVEATGTSVRGLIAQSLLGGLVTTCGCRAGPAFQSLSGETMRSFDDVHVNVVIDGRGLRLEAADGRNGSLAKRQGLSLIDAPAGLVPLDRLAWLVGPADAPAVPASAATSWLMRMLPTAAPARGRGESTATRPPEQPRRQADF